MAVVPPAVPSTSGLVYRSLLIVISVQFFGNQMAGSFWLVYLVSAPQALAFNVGVLVWVVAVGVAALVVLVVSGGRPIRAARGLSLRSRYVAVGRFFVLVLAPL